MPLFAKNIRDRIIKMVSDIPYEQINNIRTASSFSMALDESAQYGAFVSLLKKC